MNDALTLATPRLRLPYRPLYTTPVRRPPALDIVARQTIQDVPTRPQQDRSSATVPTRKPEARPSYARSASVQPLEIGVGWNTGITRRSNPNEDSIVVMQGTCTDHGRLVPFGLFVVADGMGGYDYGQEASRLAIQSLMQVVVQGIMTSNDLGDEVLREVLVHGVEWANSAVYQRGQEWGSEMGTTLTATLIVDEKAYIVNVGDSRTYIYREGFGLAQITHDHSLVARLVAGGAITPDEVYTHPERNKIYRCLGYRESVEVDWYMLDVCQHDQLLLCSDGLWELVRDPEIERLLCYERNPTRISDLLIQSALQNGGTDNVSVVVVRVA